MEIPISSTEVARTLGDCLARIKHRGDTFLITKNHKSIATLAPPSSARFATIGELQALLSRLPPDPGFADDLERVNRADTIPTNPWA